MEAQSSKVQTNMKPKNRKVVVRLLPPSLKEEDFLNSIKPEILSTVIWKRYVQGKRRRTLEKHSTNSCCYFGFSTSQDVEAFCQAYHGHTFVDERGEVFRAVACPAPYLRIPRTDMVPDKKINTYETDSTYLQFLQLFESPLPLTVPETVEHPTISPLVFALQERQRKRAEKQRREARQPQQADENSPKKKHSKSKRKEVDKDSTLSKPVFPKETDIRSATSNEILAREPFTRQDTSKETAFVESGMKEIMAKTIHILKRQKENKISNEK